MQQTEQICRYVGRRPKTVMAPGSLAFDDTVSVSELQDALTGSLVLHIEDPLSFPWDSFDPYFRQLLVIDVSSCDDESLRALRPALSMVTPVDTILDPLLPLPLLSAEFETRSTPPDTADYRSLFDEKHLHRQDRSIRDRVVAEIGEHAILQKVSIEEVVASTHSMEDYLNAMGADTGGHLVGLWGVRSKPGAPLHHGWAAFEPHESPA